MRAYRGRIEPGSPLAEQMKKPDAPAKPAPKPAPPPPPPPPAAAAVAEKKHAPRVVEMPALDDGGGGSATASNLIAVGAIVVLSLAALGLVIALVMK